jgi:hypothetical protein
VFHTNDTLLPTTVELHNLISQLEANKPIDPKDYSAIKAVLVTMYNDPMYRLKERMRRYEAEGRGKAKP